MSSDTMCSTFGGGVAATAAGDAIESAANGVPDGAAPAPAAAASSPPAPFAGGSGANSDAAALAAAELEKAAISDGVGGVSDGGGGASWASSAVTFVTEMRCSGAGSLTYRRGWCEAGACGEAEAGGGWGPPPAESSEAGPTNFQTNARSSPLSVAAKSESSSATTEVKRPYRPTRVTDLPTIFVDATSTNMSVASGTSTPPDDGYEMCEWMLSVSADPAPDDGTHSRALSASSKLSNTPFVLHTQRLSPSARHTRPSGAPSRRGFSFSTARRTRAVPAPHSCSSATVSTAQIRPFGLVTICTTSALPVLYTRGVPVPRHTILFGTCTDHRF
eukprot:Rhum_TRINITY_DN18862_c0_g1::Rhum_TRINITY_DN18862_c0_g1_i1::g.168639::m.168639